MKIVHKRLIIIAMITFLIACIMGVFLTHTIHAEQIEPNETSFVIDDDFTKIEMMDSHAVAYEGIVANKDASHGAIPGSQWESPLTLADESYLIYEISASEKLFFFFEAKLWNQNHAIVHEENKINILVSDSLDGEYSLVNAYGTSDAQQIDPFHIKEELDLSEYIMGKNKLFVKLEMIQSRATCDNDQCSNGVHKCPNTLATADGLIDIWFLGVKLYDVKISTSGSVVDREQPLPNEFKNQLPNEAIVSKTMDLPEIVFTDNVDGQVPYYITMTDPYNITTQLPVNATSFVPEYEGMYSFEITAKDNAGNTYVDKFSLSCVLAEGMPLIYHKSFPSKNGRVGVPYVLEPLQYNEEELDELDIYALSPTNNRIEIVNDRFTPDSVGEYRVIYSAKNQYGTTKLLARVYVKYNIGDQNPYLIANDTSHWVGNVTKQEDQLVVEGNAYCKIPFSLEEGINVSLTLPESGFLAFSFTQRAESGIYSFNLDDYKSRGSAPGLYLLFYPQVDGYYYNADSVGLSSTAMVVANHSACGGGFDRNITVALKKNPHADDNVQLFVNGILNENYELYYSVMASVCSDNEGFSYISMGYTDQPGVSWFNGVENQDSEAPEINISGLEESYNLNQTINLPVVSAIDKSEGDVACEIFLYTPSGKTSKTTGQITLEEEGTWYYIVSAIDSKGNKASQILEIKVGNTEKTRVLEQSQEQQTGCKSNVCVNTLAFVPILIAVTILNKAKRKRNYNE